MSGISNGADRPHPGFRELEHFMRDELPPAECSAVVRHLLTGCPRCVAVTRWFWSLAKRSRVLRVLSEEALAGESGGSGQFLRHPRVRVL